MQNNGIDERKNGVDRLKCWDVQPLIKRFNYEVSSGHLPLTSRIEISLAMRELRRRGKEVLPAIITYLLLDAPHKGTNLRNAWCTLVCEIKSDIDPKSDSIIDINDVSSWIHWAEKFVE